MKTKYILHGGAAHIPSEKNDNFFKEILNESPSIPKILICLFGKDKARIPPNKAEDVHQFERNNNGKKLAIKVADEDKFLEQIKWADIIYLHGGSPTEKLEIFKKYDGLEELFKGKTIAGESAGAYVLATYIYSNFKKRVFQGLGILPLKLICHYNSGDEIHLKNAPEDLETLLLEEYQYKVFYKG